MPTTKTKNVPSYILEIGPSMPDIMDRIKELLFILKDTELADRLGFEYETVRRWRKHLSFPTRAHAKHLKLILGCTEWGSQKCQRDTFLAYNTIVFDAAKPMYDMVATTGDAVSLTSAVHSILAKVAFLVESLNSADRDLAYMGSPVLKMHSVFGTPDYGEVMNCSYLRNNGEFSIRKVDVLIKVASINGTPQFVYQLEFIVNDQVERRTAGVINDQAIDIISRSILKYIIRKK